MCHSVFVQVTISIGNKSVCCFPRGMLSPKTLSPLSIKSAIHENCSFRQSNSSLKNLKPLEPALPLLWGTCSKGLMHNGEAAGCRFVVSI